MPDDVSDKHSNPSQQNQDTSDETDITASRQAGETGNPEPVEVAKMTSQLKSLEKKLAKQPHVDQDHVNRVREAIHRGKYQVDSDRVANKMLGFDEDF